MIVRLSPRSLSRLKHFLSISYIVIPLKIFCFCDQRYLKPIDLWLNCPLISTLSHTHTPQSYVCKWYLASGYQGIWSRPHVNQGKRCFEFSFFDMHGARYAEQFKRKVLLCHFIGEKTETQGLEKLAPHQTTCEWQGQDPDRRFPTATTHVLPGYLTCPGFQSPTWLLSPCRLPVSGRMGSLLEKPASESGQVLPVVPSSQPACGLLSRWLCPIVTFEGFSLCLKHCCLIGLKYWCSL